MKRQTTIGTILCIVGLFFNSDNASGQVGIKYLGGVHGPPDNTSMSPSFITFRANRGQQMLSQIAGSYSSVGSNYNRSTVEAMNYKKMVVTSSYESWHSLLAPGSNEHGNVRYDQGFYLYVNGGTFVPSAVTVNTKSEIWNGESWIIGGGINITTTLETVHSARIRMNTGSDSIAGNSNDQVHSVQTGSQASTGFVFIGPAVGFQPFGTGDNQQKIQNTIDWLSLNRLRLVHTVSGTSTLGPFSFVKTNEDGIGSPISDFSIATGVPPLFNISWTSDGNSYVLQRSYDLAVWTNLYEVWDPEGVNVSKSVSVIEGQPRAFWRLARQ